MDTWESLIIERAKKSNHPSISDLLELYGSYAELRNELRFMNYDQKISPPKFKSEQSSQLIILQSKLLELQRELTNSYKNKLNFDNSISDLKNKIETLESELIEKDKTIRKLQKTIQDMKLKDDKLQS